MTKRLLMKELAGVSLVAMALVASTAHAETPAPAADQSGQPPAEQQATGDETSGVTPGDIVVTARRRSESLQNVPLTVNAVTAAEIAANNLRRFEDVATVVPGLTMSTNSNGQGTTTTVRGINFDANVSGNNPSVEFYMNDAPLNAGAIFQAVYDIGQVEVLRGPQGTLRGRAAPSGSITVTTHRPDLEEFGGYVQMSGNNIGGINAQAAINAPIIKDVLALRVAGVVDSNELNRISSINNPRDPYSRTLSGRAQILFTPIDSVSIIATYQHTQDHFARFGQVESANLVDPTAAASPVTITPKDQEAAQLLPGLVHQTQTVYNLQASWTFAGQKLNYVGSYNKQPTDSIGYNGGFGLFGFNYPTAITNAHAESITIAKQQTHELRLSSDKRILGLFDYTVGAFYIKDDTPVTNPTQTVVFLGPVTPTNPAFTVITTPIATTNRSIEKSGFGNLTLHLGDMTEISGGARYIDWRGTDNLFVNNAELYNVADKFHHVIYSASVTHHFNSNLMLYGNFGTSWRPGLHVIGDFSGAQSAREKQFTNPPPETSKSFEAGIKSTWLNHRLVLNIDAYHQTFQNYPYRASSPQFYISTNASTLVQSVAQFNFAAPVPVTVNGAELEASFKATDHWSIGLLSSYAKSHIKNGLVPCNNYGGVIPTIAQINAVAGLGNNLAQCVVGYSAGLSPDFTASMQSEYAIPISNKVSAFVRGLGNFYGKTKNDPANLRDDVSAYALLSLYAGIRDPHGAWEINAYAKNVTNETKVLTRGATPGTTGYQAGATAVTVVSSYYGISTTAPREIGLNVRFAFGSR